MDNVKIIESFDEVNVYASTEDYHRIMMYFSNCNKTDEIVSVELKLKNVSWLIKALKAARKLRKLK